MKPPEEALRSLVAEWVAKADKDFQAAVRLLDQGDQFREIVGFHSQQAAEKYLKALLVRHRVEFPKTHDIEELLDLVATIDSAAAGALRDADLLTPFGVEVRLPGRCGRNAARWGVRSGRVSPSSERLRHEVARTLPIRRMIRGQNAQTERAPAARAAIHETDIGTVQPATCTGQPLTILTMCKSVIKPKAAPEI